MHVFADPKQADVVFRSTDSSKTFELLPAPHGDRRGLQ